MILSSTLNPRKLFAEKDSPQTLRPLESVSVRDEGAPFRSREAMGLHLICTRNRSVFEPGWNIRIGLVVLRSSIWSHDQNCIPQLNGAWGWRNDDPYRLANAGVKFLSTCYD